MGECSVVRERMPELLTEVLGPQEREFSHQHIEQCPSCSAEWSATREVWVQLGEVPERPVPPGMRERFLATIRPVEIPSRVVPFTPRRAPRWLAHAAAAVLLVGTAFVAGRNTGQPKILPEPASITSIQPLRIADRTIVPASQVNPEIQGHPEIQNVRFEQSDSTDGSDVTMSFDITSHVTITGKRDDKTLVNLLSYVLQNRDYPTHSRSNAIQWVSEAYGGQGKSEPEIVKALANVLKNDTHEGVRIKAVEALTSLPASLAPEARQALVEALRSDPNPGVRIKAVEALANLAAADSKNLDFSTVDALREKAGQEDENPYVRVKAAEALSQIKL
jgi:hypothetical protein